MKIKVLMITFNRPDYTRLSLKRLCETAPKNLTLTIWDNGSNKETKQVIETFIDHPRVDQIIFNKKNDKLRKPTNWFWENSMEADLLGKVDDDCLVPENWCQVLEQAHRDIFEAGMLGCWHFFPEDICPEKAQKKIMTFGRHRLMRNCWIQGSGYLMKRKVVDEMGLMKKKDTFTGYCIKANAKGFINGWYYPFLFLEHMDDPRSSYCYIKTDDDFKHRIPLSAKNFGSNSRDEWIQQLKLSAQKLQEYSLNPFDYIGVRAKIKKKLIKFILGEYFPKVK